MWANWNGIDPSNRGRGERDLHLYKVTLVVRNEFRAAQATPGKTKPCNESASALTKHKQNLQPKMSPKLVARTAMATLYVLGRVAPACTFSERKDREPRTSTHMTPGRPRPRVSDAKPLRCGMPGIQEALAHPAA